MVTLPVLGEVGLCRRHSIGPSSKLLSGTRAIFSRIPSVGYMGPSLVAELTTVGTLVGRTGPQSGWLLPAGGLGHSLTGCMVQTVPGLVPPGWWAGWVLGWLAVVSGGIQKLVLTH